MLRCGGRQGAHLSRRAANHQPLTPLVYLERASLIWPDREAVRFEGHSTTYSELHADARKLASALRVPYVALPHKHRTSRRNRKSIPRAARPLLEAAYAADLRLLRYGTPGGRTILWV